MEGSSATLVPNGAQQAPQASWRSPADNDLRRSIVKHVYVFFRDKQPSLSVAGGEQRLLKLARKIEERLYIDAQSKEEYSQPATFGVRIATIMRRMQSQQPIAQPSGAVAAQQVDLQHHYQQYGAAVANVESGMQQGGTAVNTYAGAAAPVAQANGGGGVPPGGVLNGVVVGPVNGLAIAGAPAGASTADSGPAYSDPGGSVGMAQAPPQLATHAFMSNGAPVLLRGGAGGGGGHQILQQQQPLMVHSGLLAPGGSGQIKSEGGGLVPLSAAGMIPVSGGMATVQPQNLRNYHQQQQQQQQQQVAAVQGGGMVHAPPRIKVEAHRSEAAAEGGTSGDLGDFLGTLEGAPSGSSDAGDPGSARKQQILKQQRWLLFLRHCAKCNLPENECAYGVNCTVAKRLWQHLIQCKQPDCTYARCTPSRELLKHHQKCQSTACPVCAPVKTYVARQRTLTVTRKMGAHGIPPEQQEALLAQMQQQAAAAQQQQHLGYQTGMAMVPQSALGGLQNTLSVPDLSAPVVDTQAPKRPRVLLQENMGTSLIEFFDQRQIQTHMATLKAAAAQSAAAARARAPAAFDLLPPLAEDDGSCKVCGLNRLTFEPPTLHCFKCEARIKRNQTFYSPPAHTEFKAAWCHTCFTQIPGDAIALDSFSIRKAEMEKRRNDDETEEGWVQCDRCESWVHQICGLFNKGRNEEGRGYLCPSCLLHGLLRGERKVPAERPQAMLTARDLPRCDLSDFLEERLERVLFEESAARARLQGRRPEEVPAASGLTVRVVNNVVKKHEALYRFAATFGASHAFPPAFLYKQKVVLLFQQLDGVDMCLFCMYLQEYGDDAAPPNRKTVYLSYLDSVKYFQPEGVEAAGRGIALRSLVYHEIIGGYLAYAKAHGFRTLFIWACPPQGNDFILYCHPGRQKTPRSDRLREWYHSVLRGAKAEGTVTYVSNLYDTFFEGGKDHRVERPSICHLPYLEGDYWPGEAEKLLADIQGGEGGGGGGGGGQPKGRPGGGGKDSKRARSLAGSSPDDQLLCRLGESIQGNGKDDFILAHLYETCSYCRCYIDGATRWVHPSPPAKVVIRSERTFDGITLDRPGGESSRTVQLTRFQLCQGCYDREAGRAADAAKPLGLPTGIALSALLPDACPPIPPTADTVPPIANEFFDRRESFLSLCQGNHYQFDTLRRARHSSMMVLYHLHNPSEPAFVATCNVCAAELKPGDGYRCSVCPDFDMCARCYASPSVSHPHTLEVHARHKFDETRMRLSEEDRMAREKGLQRTMALLVHAAACSSPECPSSNCAKVKALFNHAVCCPVKITGGCAFCRRMWALLQAHAKMCTAADCPVPRCRELGMLRRKQAARSDDLRRAKYRAMLREQAREQAKEVQQ